MKFWEVFRFEIAYLLRRFSTWLYFGLLLGITLLFFTELATESSPNRHANAPVFLAVFMGRIGLVSMLITGALFAVAATRDIQSGMHPLFFTTALSKADYLGGRFLGTLVVNAFLLTAIPLGLMVSTLNPLIDLSIIGPFRLDAYVQPFLIFVLPNVLIAAIILFAVAVLSRRAMAGYLGGGVLFILYIYAIEYGAQLGNREMAVLLDPFGLSAIGEQARYWTIVEQNTKLIRLDALLLWNRLLWLGLAAGMFAFLFFRFRFAHENKRSGRGQNTPVSTAEAMRERGAPVVVPQVAQAFGLKAQLHQAFAVARRSFAAAVQHRYFMVIVAAYVFFVFFNGLEIGIFFDTPTWPVTSVLTSEIRGTIGFLTFVVLVLYVGELVWIERDIGLSEVTDAAPIPNWVLLIGKYGALVGMLIVLVAVSLATSILVQVYQGYYRFELGLYIQLFLGIALIDFVIFGALALLLHTLLNNKYLSYLAFIFYVFLPVILSKFAPSHHLLRFGRSPGFIHSDMSGLDPFLIPHLWFKLYWAIWVLIFAVVANLFWVRGKERGTRRFGLARQRFTGPVAGTIAVAVLLITTLGGFIFYNTNLLNEYRPRPSDLSAEYERRYKQYQHTAQPLLTATTLHVELYPSEHAATLRGTYRLENRTAEAIDAIHLFIRPTLAIQAIAFEQGAHQTLKDEEHGYHIFALEHALQPGDSLRMNFDLALRPRGFTHERMSAELVHNGTFFDRKLLPMIGYQSGFEVSDNAAREKVGLAARAPVADLYDQAARRRGFTLDAEWVTFEAVIGTEEDQLALAPGSLRKTWTENGRRYFHYKTVAPVPNNYPILSADYAVREDRWQDVEIRVFYHPEHTFNLESMVQGIKATLAYHTKHFGPYPHEQLRIVEFPRHGGAFARSYPTTVAYSEGSGFIARVEDGIDHPLLVTAHEVAHQWWGNQMTTALVEGALITETLAQYSALMVMEEAYGPGPVRRFLGLMLDRYLGGRRADLGTEKPLLRARPDQRYISYRKGAVVMYALREYLGEEQVNTALRRFFEAHRYGGAPYPTSLDLYAALQAVAPDSLHYLLTDLFEEITLWDLRAKQVQAQPTETGAYRVTLEVDAYKVKADSVGHETRVPMDDLIEVGVFAEAEDGEAHGEPLYLQKHRLHEGEQTITVTVSHRPARAGIDPYYKLIDRRTSDNVVDITMEDE